MTNKNINSTQGPSGTDQLKNQLVGELTAAIVDLLWFSEAEYPFRVIYWQDLEGLNQNTLLRHENIAVKTKVVIQDLGSFFASATTEAAWHNEQEKTEVKRYQDLVDLLNQNLHDIQVYLIGEIEIDVYLLGTTQANNKAEQAIAGLQTKIVAT